MNGNNSNAEKFISIYNELDKYMRKALNIGRNTWNTDLIERMSKKNKTVYKYQYDLSEFSRLRNAIIHNPDKKDAEPIAEPHDFIVRKFEEIKNQIISPPIALDSIAIKAEYIFTANMDDNAYDVMKKMNDNIYTHVPIMENGKVVGIFSENTIFSYIIKNEEALIDRDLLIKDFSDIIPIDFPKSECYEFAQEKASIIEIESIFSEGFKNKKRISAIFITENGNQNEELLGLITPWDLAGYVK